MGALSASVVGGLRHRSVVGEAEMVNGVWKGDCIALGWGFFFFLE